MVILGLALGLCVLLGTCVSKVEVTRVLSPDGSLRASVKEINAGATTDFSYEVDVAREWPLRWDHAIGGFYGAGRSDCAYGVNIRWINRDTLLITYRDAKRINVDPYLHLYGRTVRIITKSGINDPSAPCGGMEHANGS